MTLSKLPLGYCTNVHPGRTVADVQSGLGAYTRPVAEQLGRPVAAGLWLARSVVDELLATDEALGRFRDDLLARDLVCYTLNAFPYGDFHGDRVKERVYVPDWSHADRLDYTSDCARVLAALLTDGLEGSISTVPLGFREFEHPDDFEPRAIDNLLELTRRLVRLREQTGRTVRLAIEPEPFCLLETTPELLEFFERLRTRADEAGLGAEAQEFLGVCYDVCHQSVEFEDVAESVRAIDAAGIRINKVHATCAIEVDAPSENPQALQALARFAEPRYLHQTFARRRDGRLLRKVDLTREFAESPETGFLNAEQWRVHFHVPVDAERLGPLGTTRHDLRAALAAVRDLQQTPHLEVETYTWDVLPGAQSADLVSGLARELETTHGLLSELEAGCRREPDAADHA